MKSTNSWTRCKPPSSQKWMNSCLKSTTFTIISLSLKIKKETTSDIQRIHNLYATSNHPDFTNMNPNDESIPLKIDPNVLKAESTSPNFKPNTHTTDFKSTHSIKPPVLFDVGKWRKEIKHVNVHDEEFQTIESWYSDISQCIGLSAKEPTYLPDLMGITPTSTF